MVETIKVEKYERKIAPLERMFQRAPYSIVTMVARIKGNVSEKSLIDAVGKVQQRHPNLRVRMKEDSDNISWLTSEGVKEIPVSIVSRKSDDHWIKVLDDESQIPFKFDEHPAIRFILVQSPEISELIILCHHIICDGMSLAFLIRDLMIHLGDPNREVEVLPDPVPISKDNLPKDVQIKNIVKSVIEKKINAKWDEIKISFDQEDYRDLNETYWKNFNHHMLTVELSEAETSALVNRCRKENVTVNSALTSAFVGAQYIIMENKSNLSEVVVAGNIRDRLPKPPGEVMGFYVGSVSLKYKYNQKKNFWTNALMFHQNVNPLYTNKKLFKEQIVWCYLAPGILESFSFKMIGGFVPPEFSRYQKLSDFSKRKDVITKLLKSNKMDSFNKIIVGTAMTNLTKLDFPRTYGELKLDRLFLNPGGAFPLAMVNLVVGAVTCAGKLSLVLEFAEETIDITTMEKIRDKAMELLLKD